MSQPPTKFWQTLNNSALVRYVLLFCCGWITVLLIEYFYTTIALFTAAGIFAALLNYPVAWLSRYIPRGFAIALTYLTALAVLFGAMTLIGLEVLTQGEGLLTQLTTTLNDQSLLPFRDFLKQLEIREIIRTLQTSLKSGLGIVQGIFSGVFTGIFGAVICLYMLIDGDKLWQTFLKLIPAPSRDRFAKTFRQSFLGFLRGQLLLMLFLSTISFLAFSLLGVNYALILALIIGVLDAIPGIGATLGVIVITLLVFAAQGGTTALKVVIACVILQQIQDNFIHPKIMGNALELNPVLLFLALFIGERVAGLLGVFLSIPIAGMIAAWMRSMQDEATDPTPSEDLKEEQF
ncbi:MAG: AI-2E family transporter [Leptolyngbya sp. Prado105]|jgi:predicted PurR-regulated permease PerM|nr:AI-2E family transporter [Leptolyngbya sp. Prado105]